jgi:hypothetical protein
MPFMFHLLSKLETIFRKSGPQIPFFSTIKTKLHQNMCQKMFNLFALEDNLFKVNLQSSKSIKEKKK